MKLKKYMVYLDDGRDCFKLAIPAKDEKAARQYVAGNGEIIAVKNITSEFPISKSKVFDALKAASFGESEIDFIIRTLDFTEICDMN
ncbi:MAG: hypothetical protein HDQ98_11745 [Lachnospiraceae bacterium]|nr:hypothetical protein [Lachnospiraceae bacterium]